MTRLSKRLFAIASFVRSDAKVADIGCDHALLDILLAYHNHELKAIAIDNKRGALKQAMKNIEHYKMAETIDLRLGNGLNTVKADEIDTVIIAGMGYASINEILTKDKEKLTNVNDLIIQPNTDYFRVRESVCQLGYFISHEKIVKEKEKLYLIIHFQKGKKKYNKKDYLLGPLLRLKEDNLYIEFLKDDIKKKEILLSQIPQKYFLRRQLVWVKILKLKQEIK